MSALTPTADCLVVRELLTEYALSTLPSDRAAFVERHLEWCAGCRREFAELSAAAASVAMALPQAKPPVGLEDRIVRAVRVAAAGPPQPWRRTVRLFKVATVAAVLLAVVGVGFGASVFGRLQSARQAATQAKLEAHRLTLRVHAILERLAVKHETNKPSGPQDRITQTDLLAAPGFQGGGGADVFTSPTRDDWALVVVGGLSSKGLPYRVLLVDQRYGAELAVGSIGKLAVGGQGVVWKEYAANITKYSKIDVIDKNWNVVLSGEIAASPSSTATPPG